MALTVGIALASFPPVPAANAATGPSRIQQISVTGDTGGAAVEIALDRDARWRAFTLSGPARAVVDIEPAQLGSRLPVGGGIVRAVRAADRPGGAVRIVFDLARPARLSAKATAAPGGALTLSLLIGESTAASAGDASPPPVAAPPNDPPGPAVVIEPKPAAPALAPGQLASRRPIVVAVDAGHGGHDPGAVGLRGLREKDVTLAVSRKLVELINQQEGMRGVLTRSGDHFVDLRQRMEKARRSEADLFLSIHADAALDRRARGSTVYVLNEKGASDEASRRLAARENAALIGGVALGDKDPVLASVLMDLSQNASKSSSIAVGDAIIGEMGRLGPLHRSRVQQAPFMVLKSPDVPSLLIETAYISNPEDERNLRSAEHQEKLAKAILAGIRRYFDDNAPVRTLVADNAPAPRVVPVAYSRPTASRATRHRVRRGDTLSALAERYNVSVRTLKRENRLQGDAVRVGQVLRIPVTEPI